MYWHTVDDLLRNQVHLRNEFGSKVAACGFIFPCGESARAEPLVVEVSAGCEGLPLLVLDDRLETMNGFNAMPNVVASKLPAGGIAPGLIMDGDPGGGDPK